MSAPSVDRLSCELAQHNCPFLIEDLMQDIEKEKDDLFEGICRRAQLSEKTKEAYGPRAIQVMESTRMRLGGDALNRDQIRRCAGARPGVA